MKKVAIIIPNYNGSHLIKVNLPHILSASKHIDREVIIIDDGSVEEDVKALEEFISDVQKNEKDVKLIKHPVNKGFSSAVNTGGKAANAELLLFLNSDVNPENGFIDPLIRSFEEDKNLFGVGCMDKSIEGSKSVLRGRGIGYWKKGMVLHKKGEVDEDKDTFWVSGGSSMMNSQKWNEIGGFDELYNPFYWEDIDLSYRARKAGFGLKFEKKSIVEHRHSEGAIKKHYSKSAVTKVAYRNQFIFIWKNISSPSLLASHILFLPYHLVNAFISKDKNFIFGFIDALKILPQIMSKRKKQMKLYRVSDKELLFS